MLATLTPEEKQALIERESDNRLAEVTAGETFWLELESTIAAILDDARAATLVERIRETWARERLTSLRDQSQAISERAESDLGDLSE